MGFGLESDLHSEIESLKEEIKDLRAINAACTFRLNETLERLVVLMDQEESIACPFCDGLGWVEQSPCGYCYTAGRVTTQLMQEHRLLDRNDSGESDDLPF